MFRSARALLISTNTTGDGFDESPGVNGQLKQRIFKGRIRDKGWGLPMLNVKV